MLVISKSKELAEPLYDGHLGRQTTPREGCGEHEAEEAQEAAETAQAAAERVMSLIETEPDIQDTAEVIAKFGTEVLAIHAKTDKSLNWF